MKPKQLSLLALGILLVLMAAGGVFTAIYWALKYDIHKAAASDDAAKIRTILAERPDLLNQPNRLGLTPLQTAVWHSRRSAVQALIESGADLRVIWALPNNEGEGWSLLHLVAVTGDRSIGEMLIRQGADLNVVSAAGETPYDTAVRYNQAQIAQLLRSTGGKPKAELR